MSFFRGPEGTFLATPLCFSWLKKTKFWKIKIFLTFCRNDSPKPWAGIMLNVFGPNMHFCPKSLLALSKKQNVDLIWLKGGFYFSYSGHKCRCWLKGVNHWKKSDDGVMCAGKENNSCLKLVRIKPEEATNTCKLLLRKTNKQCDINIVLL